MLAQSPGIGVAHVVDPALHAGVKFRKADLPVTVLLPALPQPMTKIVHIAGFHPVVVGIHEQPEPGDAMPDWHDLRLRMYGESLAGEGRLSSTSSTLRTLCGFLTGLLQSAIAKLSAYPEIRTMFDFLDEQFKGL